MSVHDHRNTHLNLIRCDQSDFTYTALQTELKKLGYITDLYPFSQTFIPELGLSRNAVRYYASIAAQYTASRLRKLISSQQSLYVLCFISHRYQEFLDNLITCFLYYVNELKQAAKKFSDDAETAYYKKISLEMPELVKFLRWYSKENAADMKTPVEFQKKGFDILGPEKQKLLADFIAGNGFDKKAEKWKYYEQKSRRVAMYLRPILLAVPFEFHKSDGLLMQLITELRDHYSKGHAPARLIESMSEKLLHKLPKKMQSYLSNDNDQDDLSPDPARLEFYIYDKMAKQIDYGRLFCNDSVSFASLEYDLVADDLVDNIEAIAKSSGYDKLNSYCGQRLDDALNTLDKAWKRTNGNISNKQNSGINIKENEDAPPTWTLTYDAGKEESSDFFNDIGQRDIADVMKNIGDRLNFWPTLKHRIFRYTKQKSVDPTTFTASLLAETFGFGSEKMAKISNMTFNSLRAMHQDYLYVENLSDGNALLSDYIDQLPVSRTWDLYENKRVADGDGQKFLTKFHTLQSRFSAKYYRTQRGISIYSIISNHIPINAMAIGPHEHESHYLFDSIYNNPTNIPIHFITGDNHSINQMNYIATDVIDTDFIPNIKHIRKEADKIYCAGNPNDFEGFLNPCGKINKELILSEQRGILRVLLSLILQENTQAVLIRKLSSHKRYSRLRSALWEYNKIFRSTHTLNVINDAKLRKVIKTARNRTESYHQLQRSLRKVYSGAFRGRRTLDNQISCQATRLVANFMIAYNGVL